MSVIFRGSNYPGVPGTGGSLDAGLPALNPGRSKAPQEELMTLDTR